MPFGPDTGATKAELLNLTAGGVLGFFTHVEATEIFVVRDDTPTPINVFSIFVAEERDENPSAVPEYLGKRIRLKTLDGWAFGIKRTLLPVANLALSLDTLTHTGEWKPSGAALQVGPLVAAPTQFVPSDSTMLVAWNHVLKNNFWGGSYVVELADPDKAELRPLIDSPTNLNEVSTHISQRLPLRIAALSDRLGNIAFQIPITVVLARLGRNRISGDAILDIAWHPKATARPVRAICAMEFDNTIAAYGSASVQATSTIPMAATAGMQRDVLWDDNSQLILAATGSTSFISRVGLNVHALDPEPRVFVLKDSTGAEEPVRVDLSRSSQTQVGPLADDRLEQWTRKRIYRDEAARLLSLRRYIVTAACCRRSTWFLNNHLRPMLTNAPRCFAGCKPR